MHPSQLYALSLIRMAEAQAKADRARMAPGRRPAPLRHVLRSRLQGAAAPLRAALVAPLKSAS